MCAKYESRYSKPRMDKNKTTNPFGQTTKICLIAAWASVQNYESEFPNYEKKLSDYDWRSSSWNFQTTWGSGIMRLRLGQTSSYETKVREGKEQPRNYEACGRSVRCVFLKNADVKTRKVRLTGFNVIGFRWPQFCSVEEDDRTETDHFLRILLFLLFPPPQRPLPSWNPPLPGTSKLLVCWRQRMSLKNSAQKLVRRISNCLTGVLQAYSSVTNHQTHSAIDLVNHGAQLGAQYDGFMSLGMWMGRKVGGESV